MFNARWDAWAWLMLKSLLPGQRHSAADSKMSLVLKCSPSVSPQLQVSPGQGDFLGGILNILEVLVVTTMEGGSSGIVSDRHAR